MITLVDIKHDFFFQISFGVVLCGVFFFSFGFLIIYTVTNTLILGWL